MEQKVRRPSIRQLHQQPSSFRGWPSRLLRANVMNKILQFLREDDGPTAVEYAVMLALIILICIAAIQAVGTQTSTSFSNSSLSIGNAMSAS